MSPGKTIFPWRSTSFVAGPLFLSTDSLSPTAIMRASDTAIASCRLNFESTVTTLPWCRIKSASAADGDPICASEVLTLAARIRSGVFNENPRRSSEPSTRGTFLPLPAGEYLFSAISEYASLWWRVARCDNPAAFSGGTIFAQEACSDETNAPRAEVHQSEL